MVLPGNNSLKKPNENERKYKDRIRLKDIKRLCCTKRLNDLLFAFKQTHRTQQYWFTMYERVRRCLQYLLRRISSNNNKLIERSMESLQVSLGRVTSRRALRRYLHVQYLVLFYEQSFSFKIFGYPSPVTVTLPVENTFNVALRAFIL